MFATLERLASDELRGRFTFSADIDRAARELADAYRAAGIAPVGDDYVVPYALATGIATARPIALTVGGKPLAASAVVPAAGARSGQVRGELVFVGYAAASVVEPVESVEAGDPSTPVVPPEPPPPAYDDLAGVDVAGKIALVLLDAPGGGDMGGLFRRLMGERERFEAAAGPLREANDATGMAALHRASRATIAAWLRPFLRGQPLPAGFLEPPSDPLAGLDLRELLEPVMAMAAALPGPRFDQAAYDLATKLERLKAAGALGVIAVRGPRSFLDDADRKAATLADPRELGVREASADAGLPVVEVQWTALDPLVRAALTRAKPPRSSEGGATKLAAARDRSALGREQDAIAATFTPRSRALGIEVALDLAVAPIEQRAPNVLAVFPGTERPAEFVMIGAHLDHLGVAGEGTCTAATVAGQTDTICNGADDNASGSAMVHAIARTWAAAGYRPKRTVVFAHYSGEELGLHGSRALATAPPDAAPFKGGKMVAMVNLDMVGRLGPRGLAIGGISSSSGWMPLLDRLGTRGLRTLYERSIASRSDHANFYRQQIPVLFFFTHVHGDYHRATDHVDKIERASMATIGGLVLDVVTALAEGHEVPFTPPQLPEEGLNNALPGDNPATVEKVVKRGEG
jgi:hypothetical protein